MRTFPQPDLPGFFFGLLNTPTVPQYPADHPKSAHPDRCSAVYKGGPVLRIVCDLQKLCSLFVLRLAKDDRNIEVEQTQFFRLRFFFGGAVLARWPKIDDCFNAVRFQPLQMLESWLS